MPAAPAPLASSESRPSPAGPAPPAPPSLTSHSAQLPASTSPESRSPTDGILRPPREGPRTPFLGPPQPAPCPSSSLSWRGQPRSGEPQRPPSWCPTVPVVCSSPPVRAPLRDRREWTPASPPPSVTGLPRPFASAPPALSVTRPSAQVTSPPWLSRVSHTLPLLSHLPDPNISTPAPSGSPHPAGHCAEGLEHDLTPEPPAAGPRFAPLRTPYLPP